VSARIIGVFGEVDLPDREEPRVLSSSLVRREMVTRPIPVLVPRGRYPWTAWVAGFLGFVCVAGFVVAGIIGGAS
jgi:hypothetical protein